VLTPSHLDWHCLADGGRDDIFDLTVALAAAYGLAVRAWLSPAWAKLRQWGLPAVDYEFLDSFRLDTDGKQARYASLLRGLPAGLSEWAVHPRSRRPAVAADRPRLAGAPDRLRVPDLAVGPRHPP
jgi:chitin disaccharide deacetylase